MNLKHQIAYICRLIIGKFNAPDFELHANRAEIEQ
jgi:hypothetical protein